ncbi:MAG TPA: biopolymer transporter ExbD [Gillisia sp.]|nr:biopolymer transporter ExbD [Gillisia sp.]
MARRSSPEINAGSMADIAFLLLIFFLVTTTMVTDRGISRKLPPIDDEQTPPIIKEKNIFVVLINNNNELLVEDEPMEVSELRQAAIEYLDNGGGVGDDACDYCQGARSEASSDNPTKAIISLGTDRRTDYRTYISVQNELVAAYNFLRNREAQRLFGMDFIQMEANYNDVNWRGNKDQLKERIDQISAMYPQKLSEAEPRK